MTDDASARDPGLDDERDHDRRSRDSGTGRPRERHAQTDPSGFDSDRRPADGNGLDAEGGVDDAFRDVVEEDLQDVVEDGPDYPSGDDPVSPQVIDLENAAFVVLGVLGMVGLVALLVLSI
jgi:hypothetical protein